MTLRVFLLVFASIGVLACRRPESNPPTSVHPTPAHVERVSGAAGPAERLPLVIAIHGYGDRPEDFSRFADGFLAPARWIFLRGFEPMGDGHAWFPIRFRDGRAEALAAGIESASSRVRDQIRALAREYRTDGPVIVTGFSQGGMISFALAVQDEPVVDAAFPIGGWLPDSMIPTATRAGVPIVAFHGADDRVVPFEATKVMVEKLRDRADRLDFVPFPGVGHTISPEMRSAVFEAIARALSERRLDTLE